MEPVYGIHLGMVISDVPDPEGRNRIQVWVPHLSNTLYKSINSKLTDPKFNGGQDLSIKSPSDLDTLDPNIVKILRTTLPWAEYGAPLFGGSSASYSNATGITSTTNTTRFGDSYPLTPPSISSAPNSLNVELERPNDNSTNNKLITTEYGPTITTAYSFGKAVGGKDSTQDPDTNGGFSSSGKNLGAGVVEVGYGTGLKIGDVIVNQYNQYAVVAGYGDISNPRSRIIDQFAVSNYTDNVPLKTPNGNVVSKDTQWFLVDSLGRKGIPSNNADIQKLLANKYGAQYLTGDGFGSLSGQDYLNAANNGIINTNLANSNQGQQIAQENQQDKLQESGPRGPVFLPRSGAYMKESNIATAGSAAGTYTTPQAGSKVWIFFIGGDIQRPVYFARAVNKGEVGAAFTG